MKIIKLEFLKYKKALSIDEVAAYLSLGKCTARKLMDTINATRKIGKRVVFDRETIDKYLDSLQQEGSEK